MAGTWGVGLGKLVPRLNRKVQPSTRYRPGSAPGHAASGASPRPATWQMAHGADASFAAEELKNASLLCERGDLLIKHHERLSEAEGCFKKALAIARRFPNDSRASDLCFTCNLGLAHIGTIKWIASKNLPHKTSRAMDTARELLCPGPSSRPATGLGLPFSARTTARHRAASAQPEKVEAAGTSGVPDSSRAQGYTTRDGPAELGNTGLTREHATAMTSAQKTQAGKTVWGVTGTDGISPEKLLAILRSNKTHAWGPKPKAVVRGCQMQEGKVTKRFRMDRDRKQSGSLANNGERPKPAAFFQPIPLRVLQTNKDLVGVPLQRTYAGTRALSTDPYAGMGAVHAMGLWAQREGQRIVGGGGAAFLPSAAMMKM